MSDWALQLKMKFNPDPNKQDQEVHFLNRTNKDSSLFITFNNSKVNKCYKIIGFLKSLSNKLPRFENLKIEL